MSSVRYRRASSTYVHYPAVVLDPTALDRLGVIAGTRPDEDPPKVVMTRADWDRVAAAPDLARQALQLLGTTWKDNPLIPRPEDAAGEEPPLPTRYQPGRAKRRDPYINVQTTDPAVLMARAKADHEARLAAGTDEAESTAILVRTLGAIKREMEGPLARPLAQPEGAPEELRDRFTVRKRTGRKDLWLATRTVVAEDFTLTRLRDGKAVTVRPRELTRDYEEVEEPSESAAHTS